MSGAGGKVYAAGFFEDAPPVADGVGFIEDVVEAAGDGGPFVLDDAPGFFRAVLELLFGGSLGTGGGMEVGYAVFYDGA